MHNFIKTIPIVLCLFFLCGCSDGLDIDTIDKSYSSDSITVKAKIPQIKGLSSEDLECAINEEYISITNELLDKFTESAKETGEMSEFNMDTTVHLNKNGLFSSVTEYEYFARASSKNSFRICKTIDTSNCIELTLSDLFCDDSYIDGINSLLEDVITESADQYQDLWAKPKISQNQRFYIDEENLVLFYPPYDLSYYERGFVEFPIKLLDISTYLKPEYREILLK